MQMNRTKLVREPREAGGFVPPRKLLKKAGNVEMWQVETSGPGARKHPIVQYEVNEADSRRVIFSRPHLALEHFLQVSSAPNGTPRHKP
jgi:hypothetical protein